ncbi:hypothetical protein [Sphingobium estronivorans]|nr:hypothetical protein [Sphingobium estronivorans]
MRMTFGVFSPCHGPKAPVTADFPSNPKELDRRFRHHRTHDKMSDASK